jgi:hypothetical protein
MRQTLKEVPTTVPNVGCRKDTNSIKQYIGIYICIKMKCDHLFSDPDFVILYLQGPFLGGQGPFKGLGSELFTLAPK